MPSCDPAHTNANDRVPICLHSTRSRLFVLMQEPSETLDAPFELLNVGVHKRLPRANAGDSDDVATHMSKVRVKVANVGLINSEYDEREDALLAIAVDGRDGIAQATLISISVSSGNVTNIADLSAAYPRLAVSAFSRAQGVYYYVCAGSRNLCRVNVRTGELLSAIPVSPDGDNNIIAMAHDENQDAVYTLQGSFPFDRAYKISVVVYNARHATQQSARITSFLGPVDFKFGTMPQVVFALSAGRISIFAHGVLIHYSLERDQIMRMPLGEAMADLPIYFEELRMRQPRVSAISTPPLAMTTSYLLTVTGANFGLSDVGQIVKVGDFACAQSEWISDNVMMCQLPEFTSSEALRDDSTIIDSGGLMDLTVRVPRPNILGTSDNSAPREEVVSPAVSAIASTESWQLITPTRQSALAYAHQVTVTGQGFREPYEEYRCIFSNDHHVVRTGGPLRHSHRELIFSGPTWIGTCRHRSTYQCKPNCFEILLYNRPRPCRERCSEAAHVVGHD